MRFLKNEKLIYFCSNFHSMKEANKLKVGIIQLEAQADKQYNLAKTRQAIIDAANQGAKIICLQELFATIYFCDIEDHKNFELAERFDGETATIMGKLAKDLGVVIITPIFEKRTDGLYHNSVIVFDADGSVAGYYRKNHIPDDPGFYEKFYFAPGDLGYQIFDTQFGRIAVLICWDQWFPEAARIVSLMGAQIIFYPTAIGWELNTSDEVNKEQYEAWQTIQQSHAIANGVWVVAVNRVGTESGTRFWGGSFVANPFGKIIYQAPFDSEVVQAIEIDYSLITHYRQIWPFMRDRRIDTYHPLLKRFID